MAAIVNESTTGSEQSKKIFVSWSQENSKEFAKKLKDEDCLFHNMSIHE